MKFEILGTYKNSAQVVDQDTDHDSFKVLHKHIC